MDVTCWVYSFGVVCGDGGVWIVWLVGGGEVFGLFVCFSHKNTGLERPVLDLLDSRRGGAQPKIYQELYVWW